MNSAVCTLFEGQYHYGLAALVNSLFKSGYRGQIFAGYKGSIPEWAASAQENRSLPWQGALSLSVGEELKLNFVKIETEYHLTNYKPFFMTEILQDVNANFDAVVYFDPDITTKCDWRFFETWISNGIALVQDIHNNMAPTHPLRMEWKKIIKKAGRKTTHDLYSYFNGGFCGVSKQNAEFLRVWIDVIGAGVKYFDFTPNNWDNRFDRGYIFYKHDQDTLNIAAMCCDSPISEMGPDGMDFVHGGFTMSHAVGSPKPWKNNFTLSAITGRPPSIADKAYWQSVSGPIKPYHSTQVRVRKMSILVASFISRFYRRS